MFIPSHLTLRGYSNDFMYTQCLEMFSNVVTLLSSGGAEGGSNDLNFFNSINRLVSVRCSHFFPFFSFFLIFSHFILSVVVLCSIVEGWVFSFFPIFSHFFSFHLIFSHFISFFLISSHCISFLMKKCIYMHPAAVWCVNCYFGKKEICQKNSLGQMLGSRAAKRARLAAANNAAGVNPMMAMGMNPLMASMFPGMMSGMQGSQQMPGMPGMMPGVQQQQDDASESEQEENTGSNGSNHAPSVAAMSMAALQQLNQLQQLQLEKLGHQKIFTRPC